jgi:hypothetical protein
MLAPKRFGCALRFAKHPAVAALIVCFGLSTNVPGQTSQPTVSEVLPASQLVQPADLVCELASASADARPTIVYVGFRTLFAGGHTPAQHSTAAPRPNRVWRTSRSGPLPFREPRISSSTAAAAPSNAAPIFVPLLLCFGKWDSRIFACWSYPPASPLTGPAKTTPSRKA